MFTKQVQFPGRPENNLDEFIIMTLFNSDLDMRLKGAIYHGEINQTELLNSIGSDIRKLCKYKYSEYTPKWAYIVTWYEARPRWNYRPFGDDLYGAQSEYKNTFQLLLISDGRESFAMFNYVQMDWPNSHFAAFFYANYYYTYYQGNSTRIFSKELENRNVSNLVDKSNIGIDGRWFLKLNNSRCDFYE